MSSSTLLLPRDIGVVKVVADVKDSHVDDAGWTENGVMLPGLRCWLEPKAIGELGNAMRAVGCVSKSSPLRSRKSAGSSKPTGMLFKRALLQSWEWSGAILCQASATMYAFVGSWLSFRKLCNIRDGALAARVVLIVGGVTARPPAKGFTATDRSDGGAVVVVKEGGFPAFSDFLGLFAGWC
jgi:hypothetical protein